MEAKPATVLFVDDEQAILRSLERLTFDLDANCHFVSSGREALDLLEHTPADVIVSDMRMPNMSGIEFLTQVAQSYPETIRLVLTGMSETGLVMDAINAGRVWGYLLKPWDDQQLILTLEQAIFTQQALSERALLRRTVAQYERQQKRHFMGFIGSSGAMQYVYNAIELSAPSRASVLITGSSGTGKEVAAEAIHALSPRKNKPFIALNCAAIPSELMESEIFGHVKGAFSGASGARQGAAELANGGSLFLDELSEMDMALQAKLLRFIQTGSYQRVGSGETIHTDIRFISATNRDPETAIAEKKLREDLYYRLNVIHLKLPDLAEREQDSVEIARHFLDEFGESEGKAIAGFSARAEQVLSVYHWPGNIRQLRNCIHNAVIMSPDTLITEQVLAMPLGLNADQLDELLSREQPAETSAPARRDPTNVPASDSTEPGTHAAEASRSPAKINTFSANIESIKPLHLTEKDAIERALAHCSDNVVQAAKLLDVSPSTLYRKINNWEKTEVN